jgi:hypothetical protein
MSNIDEMNQMAYKMGFDQMGFQLAYQMGYQMAHDQIANNQQAEPAIPPEEWHAQLNSLIEELLPDVSLRLYDGVSLKQFVASAIEYDASLENVSHLLDQYNETELYYEACEFFNHPDNQELIARGIEAHAELEPYRSAFISEVRNGINQFTAVQNRFSRQYMVFLYWLLATMQARTFRDLDENKLLYIRYLRVHLKSMEGSLLNSPDKQDPYKNTIARIREFDHLFEVFKLPDFQYLLTMIERAGIKADFTYPLCDVGIDRQRQEQKTYYLV